MSQIPDFDEHRVPWPPPHWRPGDPPLVRLLVTEREYQMLMAIRHGEFREYVAALDGVPRGD